MSVRCSTLQCCSPDDLAYRAGSAVCPPGYVRNEETGECEPPPQCEIEPVVTFSPASGSTVLFPVEVTLICNYAVDMYYTLDGSNPTTESTLYTGPISVADSDVVIKAIPNSECGQSVFEASYVGPVGEGLFAWFKADDIEQENGSSVNTWIDASGNGNDLTAALQTPTLALNFLNGKPVVRFQSNNNPGLLARPPLIGVGPLNLDGITTGISIIILQRRTGHGIDYQNIFMTAVNDVPFGISGAIHFDGVTFDYTASGAGTLSGAVSAWQIMSLTVDATELISKFKLNDLASSGAYGGSLTINQVLIQDEQGDVAEALFYRNKLSASDELSVRQYLSQKYGIPITV